MGYRTEVKLGGKNTIIVLCLSFAHHMYLVCGWSNVITGPPIYT